MRIKCNISRTAGFSRAHFWVREVAFPWSYKVAQGSQSCIENSWIYEQSCRLNIVMRDTQHQGEGYIYSRAVDYGRRPLGPGHRLLSTLWHRLGPRWSQMVPNGFPMGPSRQNRCQSNTTGSIWARYENIALPNDLESHTNQSDETLWIVFVGIMFMVTCNMIAR